LFGIGIGARLYHCESVDALLERRFTAALADTGKTQQQLSRMWKGLPEGLQHRFPKPPYYGRSVRSQLYKTFGAHPQSNGTLFRVRAPKALHASVVFFDAQGVETGQVPMGRLADGSWECIAPAIEHGQRYMYRIKGQDGVIRDKLDPFGVATSERPAPNKAPHSLVQDPSRYEWSDRAWLDRREKQAMGSNPVSIYELHIPTWMQQKNAKLSPKDFADQLARYCEDMGYTHVELMGLLEHPFEGSWGYQVTGFFSAFHGMGTLDDVKYLVDTLHHRGIGVLMDWVPAHFATDPFGLGDFDGSNQYQQNWWDHVRSPATSYCRWGTHWFNYSDKATRDFLISSARYWVEELHIDGIRVDALSAILSRHNPSASKTFLRDLNSTLHDNFPGVLTIAEDFTGNWKMTRPLWEGGFGFDYKWHTAWMHFTLGYFSRALEKRKKAYQVIQEAARCDAGQRTVMALSHDEVANMKGTLLNKTPGLETEEERLANLRLLLSYQWMLPGKKLLFMGEDRGASTEWSYRQIIGEGLDWEELMKDPGHRGIGAMVARLNGLYRTVAALHDYDDKPTQMRWLIQDDKNAEVLGYYRTSATHEHLLCLHNFSTTDYAEYIVRIPAQERRAMESFREIF
ncbi:MAG: hypothetical protein KDK78_00485, partial [Chlamydiia bacterium]|nr:hypothetical protein [Chlamydiia bacterium]